MEGRLETKVNKASRSSKISLSTTKSSQVIPNYLPPYCLSLISFLVVQCLTNC